MRAHNEENITADDSWLPIQPEIILPLKSRGALSRERAMLWALVLDSQGVECCLGKTPDGYEITVPYESIDRAYQELVEYEQKNSNWPPPLPLHRPLSENNLATVSILILLATFHNIVQLDTFAPGSMFPDWLETGSAQAGKILKGEWWRLATALTLHADWGHLAANLGIGGIFVLLLCRELGSGLAWSLLLGAGTLGNLVNAFVQPASHYSVGASTAVFGAVGVLGAISLVRRRRDRRHRWTLPVAAALALLAILGTEGKNTDLGAHLFGFLSGLTLGGMAEQIINRYGTPGRLMNFLMALGSIGTVAVAWWLALNVS